MRSFSSLFGPSPFDPLAGHMQKAAECARTVPEMVEALLAGDAEALAGIHARAQALESECDVIKNDLRAHLPRRLFLPVDRRDLLEVLDYQDSIADSVEDVGDLMVMRPWSVPADLQPALRLLGTAVVDTAEAAAQVMDGLDELLHAAFAGPELTRTEGRIETVLAMERVADEAEDALLRAVFKNEEELGAVSVVLWMRLIERMGDVADFSRKSADRMRLVIAK